MTAILSRTLLITWCVIRDRLAIICVLYVHQCSLSAWPTPNTRTQGHMRRNVEHISFTGRDIRIFQFSGRHIAFLTSRIRSRNNTLLTADFLEDVCITAGLSILYLIHAHIKYEVSLIRWPPYWTPDFRTWCIKHLTDQQGKIIDSRTVDCCFPQISWRIHIHYSIKHVN